jgi:hypothetical protein
MRRRLRKTALGSILFAGAVLAIAVTVEAQQPKKVLQIGYLGTNPRSVSRVRIEAFRQGLRELGYVEGKNITIEWRFAESKPRSPSHLRGRTSAAPLRNYRYGGARIKPCGEASNSHDSHRHGV